MALGGVAVDDLRAGPAHGPFSASSTHFPRKAKSCIFLFMQGGVSQMDSFEYKPRL
ncbi:MAG TPA: DUF1501 domain-containing protein, partial [Nitrospinaceae bacterium]|nr:DUF1501 domain-containing protein [Nitrospinaceae bacterium]